MKSAKFTVLKNPAESDVSKLLARSGPGGLRGIENYSGDVFLWSYNNGTHMVVASMLSIPYDPAADRVEKLTGKTFYIRSLGDWLNRDRRRAESDSFTSKCRNATSGPAR